MLHPDVAGVHFDEWNTGDYERHTADLPPENQVKLLARIRGPTSLYVWPVVRDKVGVVREVAERHGGTIQYLEVATSHEMALHSTGYIEMLKRQDVPTLGLLQSLALLPNLVSLNISDSHVGKYGTDRDNHIVEAFVRGMSCLTALTRLCMSGCFNYDAQCYAPGFACLASLVNLDLSKNYMESRGLRTLAGALSALPHLKTLDLSDNELMSNADLLEFWQRVPQMTCLQDLNLSGNNLGNLNVSALGQARSLRLLNLSKNNVWSYDGAHVINTFRSHGCDVREVGPHCFKLHWSVGA